MQKNQDFTWPTKVLLILLAGIDLMPRPFESKTHYTKRLFSGRLNYKTYYQILTRLEKRGFITILKQDKFLLPALTHQGKLQALFDKAIYPDHGAWDRKWRMIIFDIPEDVKELRKELRFLLKLNGFKLIQKSVYINPYPLNPEAILYLQETKLDNYIRVFRIDKVDKEEPLKKIFNLK